MVVKLLTEQHLEFLSLKEGCRGSSESTLVKMLNCWKFHAAAHYYYCKYVLFQCDLYQILFGPRREKTCLQVSDKVVF